MDTIIYLYRKKETDKDDFRMMYCEDYLFVKVGIAADAGNWFGRCLPERPEKPLGNEPEEGDACAPERSGETQGISEMALYRRGIRGWLATRREEKRRAREEWQLRQEYAGRCLEYEIRREAIEDSMSRFIRELLDSAERVGGTGRLWCVYGDGLQFLTDAGTGIGGCFGMLWNVPEFRDYKDYRWVKPLLGRVDGRYSEFILLGTGECVFEVLSRLARHMKSLQWYLREEELTESVQEGIEDFYTEYGLAITVCPLKGAKAFRTLRLMSAEPVCVLDFAEEEKLFAGELGQDSLWLDFTAMDGKRRRMERQAPRVGYESLKKQWEILEKRKVFTAGGQADDREFLDSAGKSGYNTLDI